MLAAANIEHYSFLTSNGGLSVGKQKEKNYLDFQYMIFSIFSKKNWILGTISKKLAEKLPKCNCFSPDATIKNKFRFYEFSN